MRIPNNYLPFWPAWVGILLFILLGLVCFPKLRNEINGRFWRCLALMLIGAAGNWVQWRTPGTAWFSLTVLPAAVLLVGWRVAMALNLLGSLASVAFFGSGNAFVANLVVNSLLIAFVAVTFPGYAKRLPPRIKLIACSLSTWISVTACSLLTLFVIPFFGLALWGIFGRGLAVSGLWSGLIIAIFTTIVCFAVERFGRSAGRD